MNLMTIEDCSVTCDFSWKVCGTLHTVNKTGIQWKQCWLSKQRKQVAAEEKGSKSAQRTQRIETTIHILPFIRLNRLLLKTYFTTPISLERYCQVQRVSGIDVY